MGRERDLADFLSRRQFSVLFSGGKDSLATLLWVMENVDHDRWNVVYVVVPENTHPLCTKYVANVCRELEISEKLLCAMRTDIEFFDRLRTWGVPLFRKNRWCLWQFKMKVWKRCARPVQVCGHKRVDSPRRRNFGYIEIFRYERAIVVNPLLDWTDEMVIDFIKDHGIELNPCYRMYGHSGNCMFCPYHTKDKIVRTLADPVWREKIISALLECKNIRSRIGNEIKRKWLSCARQTTILDYCKTDK